MMTSLALWWLVLSVLGWLIWPLAATLLRHTPGRGYGFARALGLLFLSYVLWLLVTVGLLPNNDASAWSVSGALGVAGLASWVCRRAEWLAYLRREWRHVLTVEALFLVVLLLYALYRAYDPAIAHTEQPMDFAFLNASLRTSSMPPEDPWLAGYPVSYYYFGYWTVAVLCRLTAIPSGAGYNLGLAHTLALTVVGAYSFLDDAVRLSAHGTSLRPMVARAFAVIGGLALALASNLEGVFEATRARGLGTGGFYRWLGVPGLADAPVTGSWLPAGRWWWWRASRIITDQNVLGRTPTVITEFPAFSFILGDLHPHVMALPYGLLALGLAIELYLVGRSVAARTWWRRPVYWVAPLVYGALGFLNSWDLPTFLFIAVAATFVGRLPDSQPPVFLKPLYLKPQTCNSQPVTSNPLELGPWAGVSLLIWLVAGSLLLYFPFYLHLSSQAQGVGLAYYAKTPLRHYLLIWGLWLPPILADTLLTLRKLLAQGAYRGRTLLAVWAVVFLTPWLAAALLGGWGRLLLGLIPLFASGPWLLLLLSALIAVLGADIWRLLSRAAGSPNQQPATRPISVPIAPLGPGGPGPDLCHRVLLPARPVRYAYEYRVQVLLSSLGVVGPWGSVSGLSSVALGRVAARSLHGLWRSAPLRLPVLSSGGGLYAGRWLPGPAKPRCHSFPEKRLAGRIRGLRLVEAARSPWGRVGRGSRRGLCGRP